MALDPNRWTQKTQEAISRAVDTAKAESNPEVTPDHLLGALLRQDEGIVLPIIQRVGADPSSLRQAADDAVAQLPKAYGGESRLSLLDRGVIFAIAHIRGGGEMGEPWHDGGKMLSKRNSFTDFIACAEPLPSG